jgi:hypothetical protein
MEVDTNELLHRIGAVLRGISKKLDLLVEMASDHFADASKIVAEEPAKEASLGGLPDLRTFAQPNLRWRILEPGEVVCSSDWVTAKTSPPSDPPNGLGWRPVDASVGTSVCQDDPCIFARLVADEPAKEPEPPKPPEPQYREPVLPADAGKLCEFSDDDKTWRSGYLKGFDYDEHRHQGAGWRRNQNCSSDRARHSFARIKKES